ncbi:hypothetical protein OPT61_g801 [Boeremia exigua]|uniref:Uncharacterized protein n=1 Tax=Boeremia exigua TaxID=749465 RepID=A0ACC2ISG4_9PLEO|nr:hypothetical protein OPT61_g801 [Boeremia exigua]
MIVDSWAKEWRFWKNLKRSGGEKRPIESASEQLEPAIAVVDKKRNATAAFLAGGAFGWDASHLGSAALSQRIADLERIVQHYTGDSHLDSETIRRMARGFDCQEQISSLQTPPPPARLANPSSNGSDIVGIDEENFTIKPLANNITHYSGEFSHWNFSMRIKQWIDQSVPCDNSNQAPNSTDFKEYYRAEELQSPSNVARTSLASLPPRGIANFLVNSFFKHAEANYFFIERHWLEEKLDTAYERAITLSHRDVGTVCVIFAVLAIGTQYAYLESYSEHPEESNNTSGPNASRPFSEDTVGVMFYQQACILLRDVITISSLESVQAFLLIGIYTLPLDASGLSYIYLNLAIKLAIQNGMHRKYPSDALDASVHEIRNRVWWTAYTIERRVGIFHGRPISISELDVDVDLPIDTSELWPSTTSLHTSHFLATLHLNQVLGKMSHEITVLRRSSKHQTTNGLGRLVELHSELLSWWDKLPDDLHAKESSTQTPVTRQSMHLRLEYCLIRIFVGRAFIFPKGSSRNTGSISAGSPASQDAAPPPPPRKSPTAGRTHSRDLLVADCIEASLAVVDTCRTLRNTIGLARASYTEFSACRAALLVIITQCLQRKTIRFRRALRDGISILKEMSAGCESARSEMSLIEAFERVVAKLDAAAAEGEADSEYSRFKKWEQLLKGNTSSTDRANEANEGLSVSLGPQPISTWRPSEGPMQRQGTFPMPSYTPFFGIDSNLASFPQTMDEFSSFLTYNFGTGHDYSHVVDTENSWMGSV